MKKRGKIFIITGPSGVGKTEIAKRILKNDSLNIQRLVTCTTRPIRAGEIDGKDYFFLTKSNFLKNIKNKKMFEYAKVYENYYGSRKADVERLLDTGKNILFTVDVQGALKLKKIAPSSTTFFITAEHTEELKRRLSGRNTDSSSVIKHRLNIALKELKLADKFDYKIINLRGHIDKAIGQIESIIRLASKRIILVEGLPGTGKSSVMEELSKKYFIIYEFHTKRKKITKQFGAFNCGKRISIGNKSVKILEDKLENIILNSRFISKEKESIKFKLLEAKMEECLNVNSALVFKEGFLGCLIDNNSLRFLEEMRKLLSNVELIIFLKLSEKELYARQIKRLKERKGDYDDTTIKKRHNLFLKQFKKVTKNVQVEYVDASPSVKEIVKSIGKKLDL